MRRGEIWVASGASYAGKPRPVLVIQDDSAGPFESTVVCLVTSSDSAGIPTRVAIAPAEGNGLSRASWVMTEKLYTMHPESFRKRIGQLTDGQMNDVSGQPGTVPGL